MDKTSTPTTGQRLGFTLAIFFLVIFMAFVNNLQNGYLPFVENFLTQDFDKCLWAINLSLAVSIFMNFIFMFYCPAWFRHLMKIVMNIFSLISTFVFFSIFPLSLPSIMIEQVIRWVLILAMIATTIGIIVEGVITLRKFVSAG